MNRWTDTKTWTCLRRTERRYDTWMNRGSWNEKTEKQSESWLNSRSVIMQICTWEMSNLFILKRIFTNTIPIFQLLWPWSPWKPFRLRSNPVVECPCEHSWRAMQKQKPVTFAGVLCNWTFEVPFTLSIDFNAAMSLAILLWLNCLDFLKNNASHSKNGLQPKLTRYDANVDADAPTKALFTRLHLHFASNFKNWFYGNKWWCSYLTFAFNDEDQRKMQTQTLSVNKS